MMRQGWPLKMMAMPRRMLVAGIAIGRSGAGDRTRESRGAVNLYDRAWPHSPTDDRRRGGPSGRSLGHFPTLTSELLMMALTLSPDFRPRSWTASFVMDAVMMVPPPMSMRTWAVTEPVFTSTIFPGSTFLALSFIVSPALSV